VVVCAAALLLLLASLVFHRTCHAGSITSITVVTKLRLCRAHSRAFLGLQRRPLQLVDRPGVHDVRHLDVLHLLVSFPFHCRLKAGNLPDVRGADVRGVPKVGWLPNHVPADLWTLPVGLRLLLHDTGAKEVDPELASHGGG